MEQLSRTVLTPQVLIDGAQAEVLFSGMAPGFIDLYQVNARVPENVAPSPEVPLVITQGGIASNNVTVAVQ